MKPLKQTTSNSIVPGKAFQAQRTVFSITLEFYKSLISFYLIFV